jgi:hypothetical protein
MPAAEDGAVQMTKLSSAVESQIATDFFGSTESWTALLAQQRFSTYRLA